MEEAERTRDFGGLKQKNRRLAVFLLVSFFVLTSLAVLFVILRKYGYA